MKKENSESSSLQDFRNFLSHIEILISNTTRVIRKLGLEEKIDKARRLFFSIKGNEKIVPENIQPVDQNNFMLWFLSDFPLNEEGDTPLALFIKQIKEEIEPDIKTLAEAFISSYISLYNIVSVEETKYLVILKDIFTNRSITVKDPNLVRISNSPVFLGLRMIKFDGKYYSGGDLYPFPYDIREHVLIYLQKELVNPRAIVPPSIKEVMKNKGYILNHLQLKIRGEDDIKEKNKEEEKEKPVEIKKENKKPDVTPSKSHFLVKDYEKIREVLEDINLISKNEEGSYNWYKSPAHRNDNISDGLIKLTKSKLIAYVKGSRDLESVKNFVIKNLKPNLQHLYDELEKRRSFRG